MHHIPLLITDLALILTVAAAATIICRKLKQPLVLGYVVDFVDLSFMDFPVFNIADIGVTCGLVLFLIGWIVRERHHEEVR